jgi:hypothetical protein
MEKLNLNSIYTKGKSWKDRSVKTVIDESYYQFRGHFNKYPTMYEKDVHDYMAYLNDKILKYSRQLNIGNNETTQ